MPYNPQIQDQRALLTLRGLEMGQHRDAMLMQGLMSWMAQRQQDQVMRETAKGMVQDPGAMPAIQDPAAAGMITQTDAVAPNYLQGDLTGAPAGGPGGGAPPGPAEVGPSPGMEEWARKADQAKAMRNLIRVYNPEAKDMTKAVDAMGHAQLEGLFKVWGLRQAEEGRQAQMAEHTARTKLLGAQVTGLERDAASEAAVGPALQAWTTATGTNGKEPTPSERFEAAAKTPGFTGAAVPKFITALANYQRSAGLHPDLTTGSFEQKETGAVFVTRGNSILPAGYNPNNPNAKPILQAMNDENGNLVGWAQTDPRGHSTFHAAKGGPMLKQAKDEKGKPLPGFYVDDAGKVHDTRGALEKQGLGTLLGASAAGAAAAAKPVVKPGEMPKLKTGDKAAYDALDPGQEFWMDGKMWKKPKEAGGG